MTIKSHFMGPLLQKNKKFLFESCKQKNVRWVSLYTDDEF